jgi:hypothetical protein
VEFELVRALGVGALVLFVPGIVLLARAAAPGVQGLRDLASPCEAVPRAIPVIGAGLGVASLLLLSRVSRRQVIWPSLGAAALASLIGVLGLLGNLVGHPKALDMPGFTLLFGGLCLGALAFAWWRLVRAAGFVLARVSEQEREKGELESKDR